MRVAGSLAELAIGATLLTALGAVCGFVMADPAVPMSECREQTFDQAGFDQCLVLQLRNSQSALTEIEDMWQTALAGELIAGTSESGNREESETIQPADNPAATPERDIESGTLEESRQFEQVRKFYTQYRDHRCMWEAGLLDSGRAQPYQQACKTSLNRQRTKQLQTALGAKRVAETDGELYRGYYLETVSGGSFQPCDRRQDWWVTGSDELLATLRRRYLDLAADDLEMVYSEVRGYAKNAAIDGPGADYAGSLEVLSLNLMRPVVERDCRELAALAGTAGAETPEAVGTADPVDDEPPEKGATLVTAPAVTVDELGAAGFLYGYFSNWISACAVDRLRVCQAQTQAVYASEGNWIFSIDRSSNSNWRIRLIPTTENHAVVGSLSVLIDGVEALAPTTTQSEMQVGRGAVVVAGERSRELLSAFRTGQSVDFQWIRPDQVSVKVSFSLTGITRALQYFNQLEK